MEDGLKEGLPSTSGHKMGAENIIKLLNIVKS